ncbi:putative disease resistance protein RGA4 [Gastrolobium bilobum]|uniref:putative disease resistance protein RGA4 n=1 Tax=Gastrolobium bilobum TaxID=150636 RepID=UPI002AB0C7C2|nr:putative disease resistance protein RGA4 [Gastrolobium bilobum]
MKSISVLSSLVVLKLYNCKKCVQLPPLGKFPSLKTLDIIDMKNVQYIDDSSYEHHSERAFASLRTLSLRHLPKLEAMLRDQGAHMFPLLSQLTIRDLPVLSLPFLPSIEHLQVDRCNKEVLKSISNFNNHLTFLQLCYNTDMVFNEQGMTMGNLYHLKTLHISEFTKLEALPTELVNLSALEELEITYCHELVYFQEQVLEGLRSLRTLRISYCEKFKSLSEGIQHLTSLEKLDIRGCPELLALPNGIKHLTHLRAMTIADRHKSYFVPFYTKIPIGPRPCCLIPEGLERVPSLHSLAIEDFDKLASLPDCLGKLASLRRLHISSCHELMSLPASIQHLTNLEEMRISHCTELGKRCKKGTGNEWYKIAHVPQVEVYP